MDEVSDTAVEDVEQTCWLWVSFLVTFSLASFAYRLFGPELVVKEAHKGNLNIEVIFRNLTFIHTKYFRSYRSNTQNPTNRP